MSRSFVQSPLRRRAARGRDGHSLAPAAAPPAAPATPAASAGATGTTFTPAPDPSELGVSPAAARRGFTLIEVLMVSAVIAILSGIVFGVARGVQNSQARAQAKAELSAIAQALEQYKAVHGDYPWINMSDTRDLPRAARLTQSLLNWTRFLRDGSDVSFRPKGRGDVPANGPEPFIDIATLNMASERDLPENPSVFPRSFGIRLVDPWGYPYIYKYRESQDGPWDNFGYLLYSVGPDGQAEPVPPSGIRVPPDPAGGVNDDIDNIYAGE